MAKTDGGGLSESLLQRQLTLPDHFRRISQGFADVFGFEVRIRSARSHHCFPGALDMGGAVRTVLRCSPPCARARSDVATRSLRCAMPLAVEGVAGGPHCLRDLLLGRLNGAGVLSGPRSQVTKLGLTLLPLQAL